MKIIKDGIARYETPVSGSVMPKFDPLAKIGTITVDGTVVWVLAAKKIKIFK